MHYHVDDAVILADYMTSLLMSDILSVCDVADL